MPFYVDSMGNISLDVAAMAREAVGIPSGAALPSDPCAIVRGLEAKGINASTAPAGLLAPLVSAYREAQAACIRQAPAAPAPASSGPTYGMRKRAASGPLTPECARYQALVAAGDMAGAIAAAPACNASKPSTSTPCDAYKAARARGQSPQLVAALAANCEAWQASNGGAGVRATNPDDAGGISPVVIGLGVLGVGAAIFFATR